MDINQATGIALRRARIAAGLKQSELGEGMGCTQGAISSYESGRSRIALDVVERAAETLGITPADLLKEARAILIGAKGAQA